MGATYRYSFNNAGTVIDVFTMAPEDRVNGAPFRCVGCGATMIPALGPKNIWHFRHRSVPPCQNETYLHELAKHVFAQTYVQALKEPTSFYLVWQVGAVCTHFEERFGYTCHQPKEDKQDLTRYFKNVAVEESVGDFRADVLLSSASGKEVILVEIAVTHPCESQKIASGRRIIEIRVSSEEDIELLSHPMVICEGNVTIYNFSSQRYVGDVCKGKCAQPIHVFAVRKSEKGILLEVEAAEIEETWDRKKDGTYHKVIGPVQGSVEAKAELFRRMARESHFAGADIRNCYICKYHGVSLYDPVFCKVYRTGCSSNDATTCDAYRPFTSIEACEAADKTNAEYLEQRKSQRRIDRQIIRQQPTHAASVNPPPALPAQAEPVQPEVRPAWPDPWTIWASRRERGEAEEQPKQPEPLFMCEFCGKQTGDYWSFNRVSKTCKCRECYRAGKY